MIENTAIIVVLLRLLGMVSTYTPGGYTDILLLVALVAVLIGVTRRMKMP